jgi:penicillin amidase
MLRAESVPELFEATRGWGLIDHNLVAGDLAGRIGHRVRALVPRRPRANGWFAVPGWTGEGDWDGYVPHEQMPEVIDPAGGSIVTANNRVVADGEPYLCTDCHPPYRAARIAALLGAMPRFGVADAASIHADVLSPHAALIGSRLRALPVPRDAGAAALREALLGWDGRMDAGSTAAAGYNALRRAMTGILVRRSGLGALASHPWAAVPPGVSAIGNLWWVLPKLLRDDDTAMLDGWSWDEVLEAALAEAAAAPATSWGEAHRPAFQHPLSAHFPEAATLLDPPGMPLGGDGDTVMAIGLVPAAGPAATYGALCRYVFDVGDWDNSRWAVFHGASGQPGSPHYADQAGEWAACRMVPMRYDWAAIGQAATATQRLRPAAD